MAIFLALFAEVSIHAPREGSDHLSHPYNLAYPRFNPRPPRGERLYTPNLSSRPGGFNPRPPRGERHVTVHQAVTWIVSIHAPREGSDEF